VTRIERRVRDLAAAMRAVGAGRAVLDGLELDLREPPLRLVAISAPAPAQDVAEAEAARDRVRYAAGAGERRRLPLGGGL